MIRDLSCRAEMDESGEEKRVTGGKGAPEGHSS